MHHKPRGYLSTNIGASFHLRTDPHTQLEDFLKLCTSVVPSIVVARSMRREIVVNCVGAAGAMRQHMISVPFFLNLRAADVATATSLAEDNIPLSSR